MTKFVALTDINSQENKDKYSAGQKWVFQATFMNYAMAHWTRKFVKQSKSSLLNNADTFFYFNL